MEFNELNLNEFAVELKGLLCDIDDLIVSMEKYEDLCKQYKRVYVIKDRLLDLIDNLVYQAGNDALNVNYNNLTKFNKLIINSIYKVEYPEDYFKKLYTAVRKYKIEYKDLRRVINKKVVEKANIELFKKVCVGTICVLGSLSVSAIILSSVFAKKTFKTEKDNKYANSTITTITPSKKAPTLTTTTTKQTYNKIDSLDDYPVTTTVTTNIPSATTTTIIPEVAETESTTTTTVVTETISETETETTSLPPVVTEETIFTESEIQSNNEFFVAPDGSIWESEEDYRLYTSQENLIEENRSLNAYYDEVDIEDKTKQYSLQF